jgi:hypothetical protein
MAEFEVPTDQEFDAITRRTATRMKRRLRATGARYDRHTGRVMITLNTDAVVGFPLAMLPGLEHATAEDLDTIEIQGGGYGLHVPSLDADIAVPELLADHLGSTLMRRDVIRAKASQANGRLGGRPRKTQPA